MKKRTIALPTCLVALLAIGGIALLLVPGRTVEPDARPSFVLDERRPFRLEFGRGSGWHGLDTIKIDTTGVAVLHRQIRERRGDGLQVLWETAELKLSPAEVSELVARVNSLGLLGMHKAYHDLGLADGTQWVFWVRQAGNEKSIYFNNNFPAKITEFANAVDELLDRCGLARAQWQRVPEDKAREHEKDLWRSIH